MNSFFGKVSPLCLISLNVCLQQVIFTLPDICDLSKEPGAAFTTLHWLCNLQMS